MTNLTESAVWESGIFELETTTPTLGGPPAFSGGSPITGHANTQAQQLANRTQYLKQQITNNNPITAQGDLIIGDTSGLPSKLGKGTNGQVLSSNGTTLTWTTPTVYMSNPMTTAGDVIVGGTSGAPNRLALGTNGQVLSSNGTTVTWSTPTVYMSNPMTTSGDIIYGGASGAPTRLAVGTNGYVLTLASGVPSWAVLPVRQQSIIVAASDETTALTTGTAKVTFRMPYAFTLSSVRASLTTAQTSGSLLTIDVKVGGVTVFSTKPTFDNTSKTTIGATTPPVLSTTALASDAEITVDITQIGDGTAKGLKVSLIGVQP